MQTQRVGRSSTWALAGALLALGAVSAQAQAPAPMDPAKQPPTAAGPTDLFTKADASRDGKLSRDEAKVLPGVGDKFDLLDKDKDGSLSLTEFSAGFGK